MVIIKHKDWNIDEHATGRFKDGKPIIGATLQNGLNDIEPDGSFVPCDMGVEAYQGNVTTHKIKRGRYGRLGFTDSISVNKHLCKLIEKDGTGLSFKHIDGDSDLPDVSNGRPSFVSDNGVTIEHTPTYKGVRIELVINDPLTAPTEYSFSIKKYKQDYTFVEQNGGIVATGENGKKITIHAPYAVDANGEEGPVTMMLTGEVGGYMTFKKVVNEAWLRQAAVPVRIDPNITIDDVTGTLIDTFLSQFAANRDNNYGASAQFYSHRFAVGSNETDGINWVDLTSLSGVTVINAHFGATIQTRVGNGYNYKIHRVLAGDWIEGTKNNTTAGIGEPCFNWRKYNTVAWNIAGCRGAGTDYQAIPESTTFVGLAGTHTFDLTAATLQDMVDNPATNYGFIWRTDDAGVGEFEIFHSSEDAGGRPFLYVEYTEVVTIALSRSRLINLGGNLGGLTKSTLNNLGGI